MVGVVVGIVLLTASAGFALFLRDFGRLADDLYPWGKDGETMEGGGEDEHQCRSRKKGV